MPASTDFRDLTLDEVEQLVASAGERALSCAPDFALGARAWRGVVRRDARSAGVTAQLSEAELHHRASGVVVRLALVRRHAKIAHTPRRRRRNRVGDHTHRKARDALHVEPGRMRDGLRILRDRAHGIASQPHQLRDARADFRRPTRTGRGRGAHEFCFHGDGRAARELSAPDAHARDHDVGMGDGHLAATHHRFDCRIWSR